LAQATFFPSSGKRKSTATMSQQQSVPLAPSQLQNYSPFSAQYGTTGIQASGGQHQLWSQQPNLQHQPHYQQHSHLDQPHQYQPQYERHLTNQQNPQFQQQWLPESSQLPPQHQQIQLAQEQKRKQIVTPIDLNDWAKQDPFLAPAMQEERQVAFGLKERRLANFIEGSEFVSIGNYCAVSNALQALGLRKHAYPFDWVRSPATGVIRCFDTGFSDFLSYSSIQDAGEDGVAYTNTPWGGSFWHHDPNDAKVRSDFTRRIERILGCGDVPAKKPRVFVRAANSTRELDATLELHAALRRALPQTKVYLLVLIDFQEGAGPVRLEGQANNDLLFYRIHRTAAMSSSMEQRSQGYWLAIVFAIRLWACWEDAVSVVPCLTHVRAACDAFDGGSAATALFAPTRLPGPPVAQL